MTIPLSVSELGNLWQAYQEKSLMLRLLEHFLEKASEGKAQTFLQNTYNIEYQNEQAIRTIFINEGAVIPAAFSKEEVNSDAPRLFDDDFVVMHIRMCYKVLNGLYALHAVMSYREDIRILYKDFTMDSEGFIEIIPQSGCKVIDYQRKVVLDQFLLTSTLEQLSAELAATNYTYSEMEALESFHRHIKSNKQNLLDKFFFFKYNRELHFRILSMAHSAKISKFAMQMMDLNDFFLLNLFSHFKFDVLELVNYHSEIINAIKARNEVKAKKVTEEHTNYINYLKKDLPFEVAMI